MINIRTCFNALPRTDRPDCDAIVGHAFEANERNCRGLVRASGEKSIPTETTQALPLHLFALLIPGSVDNPLQVSRACLTLRVIVDYCTPEQVNFDPNLDSPSRTCFPVHLNPALPLNDQCVRTIKGLILGPLAR